jgi:glyoxylase-like metal-dependent hydrolase (beta-lactamase superfamily II)/ferredoxin
MANRLKIVPANVPGEFFVDTTCIDCDTCRQLAPSVFGDTGEFSYVEQQPRDVKERRSALQAVLCCPTGSIGSHSKDELQEVREDFPLLIEGNVHYCGFNSAKSFGGNSYFVRRAGGNWLIDSPKFLSPLAAKMEMLGGVHKLFLTHSDDVADASKYAERFASKRIIHREELDSQPTAEIVLDGFEPRDLAAGIVAIPTPGHTAGHCVLLVDDRYLFTGDHLWWDPENQRLGASESYCWHSWSQQIESMERLQAYEFQWVLPGHGQRIHLPAERMQEELARLIHRMKSNNTPN